ncbi:FMN-dependent NADH-azoreductase [Aquibacillus kalidii]|uniref:FMN-dependent NADH-azoreductase n=1 Tax=Aquibacillus kalidii TaxID=2762597 RepID=UPI001645399F|nr:FMN-dependent NADH-azoreductase [Aquibacillus kalidii]
MNILIVKANDRPVSESITSKMYETFMEAINGTEGLNVTSYDVFSEDMPYFGQDLFNAFNKLENGSSLTEIEQRIINAKQKAMDSITSADVIVLAFPMWNLTIPAKLQTFIDYVYSPGFTFNYSEDGSMIPLMKEKKVILLNARGGVYSTPEMGQMDMSINYVRNVFGGIFGMEIIDEVIIEGHNAMPDQADQIIRDGIGKVQEVALTRF